MMMVMVVGTRVREISECLEKRFGNKIRKTYALTYPSFTYRSLISCCYSLLCIYKEIFSSSQNSLAIIISTHLAFKLGGETINLVLLPFLELMPQQEQPFGKRIYVKEKDKDLYKFSSGRRGKVLEY